VAKKIYRRLKEIALELRINIKITFYLARHTMASILLSIRVDTRKIQQLMGHSDMKTTQTYLESLNKNSVDEVLLTLYHSHKN